MRIRSIIITILITLFLVVVAQNTEVVAIRLLLWNVAMSRILLLLGSLGLGVLIGFLLGRPWRRRKPTRPVAAVPTDRGTETDSQTRRGTGPTS